MRWLIQAVNGLDKHGNAEQQVMRLLNILSLVILNMYFLDESGALQWQSPFYHHNKMRIIPNCLLVACSVVNTLRPLSARCWRILSFGGGLFHANRPNPYLLVYSTMN